jgi:hypothetical protein
MNLLIASALFERFTDDSFSLYDMSHPFIDRGYLWATNSRICVRYKTAEPDSTHKDGKPFPDCFLPFKEFKADAEFVEATKDWTAVPCWACDETGDCSCDSCTEVEESADVCQCCGGSGEVHFPRQVKIGTATVATNYAATMHTLPGLRVAIPKEGEETNPISFIFDGGEGLLMPLDVSRK